MRIASVRAIPVSVPTRRPCAWSRGTGFGFTRTVLEIVTDEGLVGLGECEGAAAAALITRRLTRRLRGLPVHDIAAVRRLCHLDFRDYGSLSDMALVKGYAAIEMAMWDLIGKAARQPVYRLLGGAVRPRAEFGAYGYSVHLETAGVSEKDVPALMAAYAAEAVARTGATTFEFKVGRFSAETDIETIRAVRQALGERIILEIDANMAYDMDRARRVLRALRNVRIDWFEEPVESFADMQRLRAEFPIPLSSHCTDPEKLSAYPAIEGVVGDLHLQGGLLGLSRAAAAIRALGRRFWQRSALELGISWAAMVHIGIVCPDIDRASQGLIDYVEDDLVTGPLWSVRDGGVVPPEQPGLGVELDRDALGRYAEAFREKGELTYFDAP